MKSFQFKNITPTNSNHSPFFQKEESNNFFEKSNKPFFNSSPIQAKLAVNQPNDPYEKEADAMADNVVQRLATPFDDRNGTNNTNDLSIQRKCADCEHEEEKVQKKEADAPVNTTTALPQSAPATPAVTNARFIVDDNAAPAGGQMRKTDFLNRLKEEICVTVNQALAGTPFSSDNCPYIQAAFARHQNSTPLQLEQLIARYEPSTAQAQSVDDLIQRMKVRVYTTAKQWVRTGGDLSGATQIFGGIAGGIGSAIGGIASAAGGIASTIGGIFFKANDGGANATQSPQAVMQSLGRGHSLDSASKGKMESAFGTSFSNVEVHTDSNAANLSSNMNARAFTVGNHIAFGNGEYKPGTIEGDAVMAHELTHTIQQSEAYKVEDVATNEVETNANDIMLKAISLINLNSISDINSLDSKYLPKKKSQLSIQRCSKTSGPTPTTTKTVTVNIVVLNGSTDNSVTDISTSNSIFSRNTCNIRLVAGGPPVNLDATQTTSILGSDNLIEEPSGDTASSEEQSLTAINRSPNRLTAYYVPGFNPSKRGTSLQQPSHGVPDSLLMSAGAASDTFTHELCHILSRGRVHNTDPNNLMADGTIRNVGVDNLTTDQCAAILTTTSYPQ